MTKVAALTRQVDRVRHSLSLNSLPGHAVVGDLLDSLISSVVHQGESVMTRPRQCHHCHRPTSHPEHIGIGAGINICSLEHFELCPGGRQESLSWTGCPDLESDAESGEESVRTVVGDGDHLEDLENKRAEELSVGSTSPSLAQEMDLSKTLLNATALANSLQEAASQAEHVLLDVDDDDEENTDDQEEEILLSEIEQLKIQMEANSAKDKADRKEQKRLNRLRLEKEKADLIRKSKANKKQVLPSTLPVPNQFDDQIQRKAADLAARQQRLAAERLADRQTGKDQLTISGVRSLPGSSLEVEKLLASLQALVPSLAKAATAPSASGQAFQPQGVLSGHGQTPGDGYDRDFVFNPGSGKFVRVVHSPTGKHDAHKHKSVSKTRLGLCDVSDVETSEDEDCSMEPSEGYRLVWKRDEHGEKYFIQKKLTLPVKVKAYVYDDVSGRFYKREVSKADLDRNPAVTTVIDHNSRKVTSLSTPLYRDHRQVHSSPVPMVRKGVRTPTAVPLPLGERLPGIVPIDSERQGKTEKVPDRIQWARNCPVSWTSKASASNINVVLWAWSFFNELLATRTGMAPNLETGELEARLQHFCHVLEITLQTSGQADFGGDSWAVARLYDCKVQQKVDSKMFSWVQLSNINHGASLPHEMIAATQELAKKTVIKEPLGGGKKTGEGKGNPGKDKDKPYKTCFTWNKSDTRGKCQFEVENPQQKCKKIHECTWCKTKQLTPIDHQRSFCRKRLAEEED